MFAPACKMAGDLPIQKQTTMKKQKEIPLTKYMQFRIEVEDLLENLSFDDANKLHKIFLKYLELNEKQISDIYMAGWRKGTSYLKTIKK
jgi:hypothetical protein